MIVAALAAAAYAGAWTKEAGEVYAKLGADFYDPLVYVDPATGEETELRYFGQQYGAYAEVGVLDARPVQLDVYVPVSVGRTAFEVTGVDGDGTGVATTTRLGDARVAIQAALWRRGVQVAAAVGAKVPLYANDRVGAAYPAWQPFFPLVGDGQLDVEARLHAGGSVPDTPFWLEGLVGYRHRTEVFLGWTPPGGLAFVDGVPFRATLGARLGPAYVMGEVDGLVNVVADDVTRQGVAAGPKLLVDVGRGFGVEARAAWDVWAVHAPRGVSFGGGVSWRR